MILRRVARPLLASIFLAGGINALRQKEAHAEAAKPMLDKTVGEKADQLPESVPTDAVTFVQVDAGVKIVAGTMLSLGVLPRIASLMLLGSLVPTTVTAHAFWEEQDPQQRQQQLTEFLKNVSLAGGLLLSVVDTEGKPSLGWRAKHAAEEATHQVQDKTEVAQRKAEMATAKASKASEKATARAAHTSGRVGGMAKGQGKAAKTTKKGMEPAMKSAKKRKQHTASH